MEILRVEHLSKIYQQGGKEVAAIDDISFKIEQGEFVAIVGPSGSGKSTLLHLLGGVDRPSSGKVFLYDSDIYNLNQTALAIFRRRQVGLVYQFYNLLPTLTVTENITLPVLLDHQPVDQEKLTVLLHTLGLENQINYLPDQLSGGQQQRVSIGRALINQPALLLADEPTGNLDSINSQEILDLLRLSNEKFNQTILVITHDPQIALKADRVITIEDGHLVKDEVIRQ